MKLYAGLLLNCMVKCGIMCGIIVVVLNTQRERKFDMENKRLQQYREVFETQYTWKEGYMRNVYRYGDKKALSFPETNDSWTYSELNTEVNKLSNAMLEDGVKHGDVVMYLLQNCPVFVFAYVASHKIGAINAPMNYRLSAGEVALNIDESKPEVLIYELEYQTLVQEALAMVNHRPKRIILVDVEKKAAAPEGVVTYEDYVKNCKEDEPQIDFVPNIYDETTRLFTSGTTGKQKSVPLTSINEVLSAHDIIMHFPLNQMDITMNTTPWFHRGGIHCAGPTPTLYAGGHIVALRKFDAKTSLLLVEKYGITYMVGVPTVLESLTKEQEASGFDLSSLKGIVTMGSPLERAACIRYQSVLTPNIYNGYGTTETLWNTFLRPFDLPDNAGTAGGSCLDDDVRVVKTYPDRRGEYNEEVAMDNKEVGEVIIKSPAKAAYCYFNNDEETQRKFHNGYYYTNDLATWDKNKYVTIVGRKDDMIISSGENIYPTQVEEVLNSHEKVAECIVTSVPDKVRGELVTAYVVKADESLTYEELEEFCKNSPMIANYKRPRYYRFIAQIPLGATGKKLHYKIKEIAREDLLNGLLYRA